MKIFQDEWNEIYNGEALDELKLLPDESINCVITSPPYWGLRDYGVENQLGLEKTFQQYIDRLILIFNEVKRTLKKDGTCWVNLGDTYGGSGKGVGSADNGRKEVYVPVCKPDIDDKEYSKCLFQIPSRFAIAMTDNKWILRNELIWHKPNCMPSSVTDRFTVNFEKIFFFVKSKKYWFEQQFDNSIINENRPDGIVRNREYKYQGKYSVVGNFNKGYSNKNTLCNNKENRNKRTVWTINTRPFPESHFAVFPPELVETSLKAGCPEMGIVLDPFAGSGTTGAVAKAMRKKSILIELNPEYCKLIKNRIESVIPGDPITGINRQKIPDLKLF